MLKIVSCLCLHSCCSGTENSQHFEEFCGVSFILDNFWQCWQEANYIKPNLYLEKNRSIYVITKENLNNDKTKVLYISKYTVLYG